MAAGGPGPISEFEWDEAKAAANLRKHGVAFAYSARVFADPDRIERLDDSGYPDEERWKVIGLIETRVYVVVYTERAGRRRLISARRAARSERELYHDHLSA